MKTNDSVSDQRHFLSMGYLTFAGSAFIAFGPSLAIFVLHIARSSQLILLSIGRWVSLQPSQTHSSSFTWLLAIFFSALLWFAVIPLREYLAFAIPFSVLLQEAARFGFWKLYTYV